MIQATGTVAEPVPVCSLRHRVSVHDSLSVACRCRSQRHRAIGGVRECFPLASLAIGRRDCQFTAASLAIGRRPEQRANRLYGY
jgi:hypothetical protein